VRAAFQSRIPALPPIAWRIAGRACDGSRPSDRRFACVGLLVPVNDTSREPLEIAAATHVRSAYARDGRYQMTSTSDSEQSQINRKTGLIEFR
jgi:hypothetical protein